MKLFFLLIFFAWSGSTLSIEQQQVKAYGHWPTDVPVTYQAVLPKVKKTIKQPVSESPDKKSNSGTSVELFSAVAAGLMACIPIFMLLGFW